jgi:hypothetical protein
MYTAFGGAAILVSLLITKQILTKKHEETKVGLDAEREKAKEAEAAKKAKKEGLPAKPDGTPPQDA